MCNSTMPLTVRGLAIPTIRSEGNTDLLGFLFQSQCVHNEEDLAVSVVVFSNQIIKDERRVEREP